MPRRTRLLCWAIVLAAVLTTSAGCRIMRRQPPNVVAAAGADGRPPAPAGPEVSTQPLVPETKPEPPLFVYVSGAVLQPGVYQMTAGARGCDALAAAGGPAKGARLEFVNLAALLTDGQQLHIPTREEAGAYAPPGPGSVAQGAPRPINVNRAAAAELMELPGIGAVLAGRIVAYRAQHGPFRQADDLLAVPGIGESRLRDIESLISLSQ